jgi:putative heme iron utilization protein
MNDGILDAIRSLLETTPVLTAAVVVEGEPVAALLPFAISRDGSALIVHVSGLARHAQGMRPDAAVGVLVHEQVTAGHDPMQVPRLSVRSTVRIVERGTVAFDEAADRLISRFPGAATTLALSDFTVCELVLGRGRFVQGFAGAVNVDATTFRALA